MQRLRVPLLSASLNRMVVVLLETWPLRSKTTDVGPSVMVTPEPTAFLVLSTSVPAVTRQPAVQPAAAGAIVIQGNGKAGVDWVRDRLVK